MSVPFLVMTKEKSRGQDINKIRLHDFQVISTIKDLNEYLPFCAQWPYNIIVDRKKNGFFRLFSCFASEV